VTAGAAEAQVNPPEYRRRYTELALHLIENLVYRPAVVCTGAAIAFLSGKQAHIPIWADRTGLGWLWRCFYDPKKFIPRYLSALSLFMVILRFGPEQPLPRLEKAVNSDHH